MPTSEISPLRRLRNLRLAEEVAQVLGRDADRRLDALLDDLAGDLAADAADLALEVPHARLARVARRSARGSSSSENSIWSALQAVGLALLRHEELPRDRDLLVGRVAGEGDDLHPVLQRRRDRVGDVGRRDEHDLARGRTRRRGSGRRTSGSAPDRAPRAAPRPDRRGNPSDILSTSSRRKTGLTRPRLLHHLDDLARERADVGAPVTADLRLVAHAAERQAHELAVQRRGRSTSRATSCRRRAGRRSR